ncbi:hypothetical protein Xentx_03420 [Xenorhabdus thuongxuanensis]|uniref:Uncharacterized protein n=1 Tax=Xenorhabdus thuongxuanensis TaxID=1873484 RepID=A0A1Q5TMU7_9GAMM|nr:hypothetical protein Xentx_03420 [Xenorhabdus thuongxuanensis]
MAESDYITTSELAKKLRVKPKSPFGIFFERNCFSCILSAQIR